ncbi:MAG: nuclear transport factor 2 family protein [Desulfobacteraceae bacterium]|jgi:ketosteroid isomerase-like protein
MTEEEQKMIIQSYIAAYNSFDIDGMVALVHQEVVFKNIADAGVNAEATGAEQFRELAVESKAIFSSRHQKATNFKFTGDVVTADIALEAVLAVDLPNGMKAGEVLRLEGRSEFEFKNGKLYRITDYS